MIVTSKISMDLYRRGVTPRVDTVQDDKYSRNVEIALYAGGVALEMPEDTTALVRFAKPDSTGGTYDALPDGTAACSIGGNVVTVALAPQVCTTPGIVRLVVALISGDTQLHTFLFNVDVQPNPGLQVTSEGYYKVTGALADSGWEPNTYLGTDEDGNVVALPAYSYGTEDLTAGASALATGKLYLVYE